MSVGLAASVTAAVVLACAGGAYIYSRHHFNSLIENARAGVLGEADLIRVALEHQMMENDRTLIARMVDSLGRRPRVKRLALLDRQGVLRYSSGPPEENTDLHAGSPTCQACHNDPPERRTASRVIEAQDGAILRTVVPIHNRAECHRCHDPAHTINGILLLDTDAGEIRASMTNDLRWMVLGTSLLTLTLIGALALVIRIFVLRRLQRFETTARLIAAGDLQRRVPAEGSDTVAWLAREFNTMADSVTGLVGEVRSQRERLERVINSIDDGIVVLDTQRRVLAANDAFLRRAGQSREQALGCCCQDVPPAGCNREDCPALGCLRSGERQVRLCERQKPDGAVAWEEIHASPIRDAAGNVQQVVEVWRDISQRRAAEAHLADSHRLASLGMLASGFSHEINTPLATTLACIESILREAAAPDPERLRETAATAREQILRCRGITQHFLRISRGQRTEGQVVDLADVVAAVARLVAPTARAHGVTVAVEAPESGLHVRADEAELQQALINLQLNAVQASPGGGVVTVRAAGGEQVRVSVSDNGCGIGADNLKRIFEPFFSLRAGGTGLGLFLTLNFVRRWGGDIRVESEPGQGATFEIVLPAAGREVGA